MLLLWSLGLAFLSWQNTFADKFTKEILIKILAVSSCIIDFFCKSMAASNFCDDIKYVLGALKQLRACVV